MPVLKTFFSPYFVKKIASYGLDLKALHLNRMSQSTFRGNKLFEEKKCRESGQKPRFSFLYQRASDEIGKGLAPITSSHTGSPTDPHVVASSSSEILSNVNTMASRNKYFKDEATGESKESKSGGVAEKNPAKYFRAYRHETKVENALYRTSQSVIGARPPTIATIVTETHKFPQPFSKSLGSLSYRNQSLNTTKSRSKIHRSLDPQF